MKRLTTGIVAMLFLAVACDMSDLRIGPDDVEVADPAATVKEARRMIQEHADRPENEWPTFEPADLPDALKMKGIRGARLHGDHIDFLLGRVPDLTIGARIWSAESKRIHLDQQTRYPGIYYFQYNGDLPIAPDNID
jgi:hypothetical protein